ncbi:MAG: TolC family protein [Acidiferrobacteraceae bacterium]
MGNPENWARRVAGCVGVACLALAAPRLFAQTLDPAAAVTYALAHNPALRARRAEVTGAHAAVAAARARARPRLTAGLSYGVSDDPLAGLTDALETRAITGARLTPPALDNPGTQHLSTTRIALTFPLYAGGAISAGIRGAHERERASRDEFRRRREQVAARTLIAYYGVLAATQGERIARAAVRRAARHVRTTRHLLREGRIVRSDWLMARANLAAMQGLVSQATAALSAARSRLRLVMGLPARSRLALVPAPLPPPPASARSLVRQALHRRPDLRAIVRQWRAAEAQWAVARAARRPEIGVRAANDWYGSAPGFANRSWSVMATLREPIYDGGAATAHEDVARARARALAFERRALAARIRAEVRNALVLMQSASQRLSLATLRVTDARRAARLIRRRYGEGRTLLLDLLQSEESLTQARIERERARYALLRGSAMLALADGETAR